MQLIEAFDTFSDAEYCALSYFDNGRRKCLSTGNYTYYSDNASFEIWVYVQDDVWSVIRCPPNSWNAN